MWSALAPFTLAFDWVWPGMGQDRRPYKERARDQHIHSTVPSPDPVTLGQVCPSPEVAACLKSVSFRTKGSDTQGWALPLPLASLHPAQPLATASLPNPAQVLPVLLFLFGILLIQLSKVYLLPEVFQASPTQQTAKTPCLELKALFIFYQFCHSDDHGTFSLLDISK